jgi:release factor glutamine methyltransferase
MTLREAIAAAAARIGGEGGATDAQWLLAHVLGRDRTYLVANAAEPLPDQVAAAFESLVARRAGGEPVAYLTGRRGFWSFDVEVGPAVLIPRPETELLVEFALDHLPRDRACTVADLGTGSGAIAIAVALERPRAEVVAVDASAGALEIARRNAARLAPGRVTFIEGSWWTPLKGRRFDLVLSNPPYIPERDPHLARGDLRFEPRAALAAGLDGFDALRAIVEDLPERLAPGGHVALEHGYDQAAEVRALLAAVGLRDVATIRDLAGHERISVGRSAGWTRRTQPPIPP